MNKLTRFMKNSFTNREYFLAALDIFSPFWHFQLIFQVGTVSIAGGIGQGLQHKVPHMILNPNGYQLASHDLEVIS